MVGLSCTWRVAGCRFTDWRLVCFLGRVAFLGQRFLSQHGCCAGQIPTEPLIELGLQQNVGDSGDKDRNRPASRKELECTSDHFRILGRSTRHASFSCEKNDVMEIFRDVSEEVVRVESRFSERPKKTCVEELLGIRSNWSLTPWSDPDPLWFRTSQNDN